MGKLKHVGFKKKKKLAGKDNLYRLVSGFKRMRSDDVALNTVESKSERVILDSSDLVRYGLRSLHALSISFYNCLYEY